MTSSARPLALGMSTIARTTGCGQAPRIASIELWRERYPGGLSEIEEAFSSASSGLAGRRRRRRRLAASVGVSILVAVLAVVTGLWRRSVLHEHRAEAQKLIALGTLEMEDYPTGALAYATRSLELANSEEARFLALESLWKGPTAFPVNEITTESISYSPGESWLVQTHAKQGDLVQCSLEVISKAGKRRVVALPPGSCKTTAAATMFGGEEDFFFSQASPSSRAGEMIRVVVST